MDSGNGIVPVSDWEQLDWIEKLDWALKQVDMGKRGHVLSKLMIGRALYYLRVTVYIEDGYYKKLYQAMYDRWADFCASPEIDIPASTARNLIAIWRYHSEHPETITMDEIATIGHKKMTQIMPMLRQLSSEEAKEWVEKAKEYSSSYLAVSLAEVSRDVPFVDNFVNNTKGMYCPKCDAELICPGCGWGT